MSAARRLRALTATAVATAGLAAFPGSALGGEVSFQTPSDGATVEVWKTDQTLPYHFAVQYTIGHHCQSFYIGAIEKSNNFFGGTGLGVDSPEVSTGVTGTLSGPDDGPQTFDGRVDFGPPANDVSVVHFALTTGFRCWYQNVDPAEETLTINVTARFADGVPDTGAPPQVVASPGDTPPDAGPPLPGDRGPTTIHTGITFVDWRAFDEARKEMEEPWYECVDPSNAAPECVAFRQEMLDKGIQFTKDVFDFLIGEDLRRIQDPNVSWLEKAWIIGSYGIPVPGGPVLGKLLKKGGGKLLKAFGDDAVRGISKLRTAAARCPGTVCNAKSLTAAPGVQKEFGRAARRAVEGQVRAGGNKVTRKALTEALDVYAKRYGGRVNVEGAGLLARGVKNPTLKNVILDVYRGKDRLFGGSAGLLKQAIKEGKRLANGKFDHEEKVRNARRAMQTLLEKSNAASRKLRGSNPSDKLGKAERQVVKDLFNRLDEAYKAAQRANKTAQRAVLGFAVGGAGFEPA